MKMIKRLNDLKVFSVGALAVLLLTHANPAAAYPQVVDGTVTQQTSQFSTAPATQDAISAIVAVKSGDIYAPNNYALGGKVIGHYSAGQKFCMTESSTGPNGAITLDSENPGSEPVFMAIVANDGSFIPDTTPGSCPTVATTVDVDAQQAQVAQANKTQTETIITFAVVALIIWGPFVYLALRPFGGVAFAQENAEALFPGHHVAGADFEAKAGHIYRVNSNGVRVPLSKWDFDAKTGEFYRIKGRHGNRAIIESKGYDKRFSEWRASRGLRMVGPCIFLVIALIGFLFPMPLELFWVLGFASPAVIISLLKKSTEAKWLGPEPLTRTTEDFGPTGPASPPMAADDLGYNPTI